MKNEFRAPSSSGPIACALGLLLSSALPASALAAEPATFSTECAYREVQVITLIEAHGDRQDVPSDKLAEAGLQMLQARASCYEGRVSDALALYDGILTDTMRPLASLAGQAR